MAPEEGFAAGDVVQVKDGTASGGLVGTLTKTVGRGRWALKVEGEERTKVVLEGDLEKFVPTGDTKPKDKFCIVGTWDDWEPQEMSWNAEAGCLQYRVTLGHDGAESFKVLVNGDWDHCIYPDRKDACPHQAHVVKGPDEGGMDEEWTIGLHPADEASTGDIFDVKVFLSHDGRPKRVTWDKVEASPKPSPKMVEKGAEVEEAKAPPSRPRPTFDAGRISDEKPVIMPLMGDQSDRRPERGVSNWSMWTDERMGDKIVQQEKEARERLAKRFEEAAQIGSGMAMIRNEEEDPHALERMQIISANAQEARDFQVEANKERYRRSIEENVRERAAMTKAESRNSGQCTECGQVTTSLYGQSYCCEPCLESWQHLREDGWDGTRLCGGLPAAERARQLFQLAKGQLTPMQARRQVMREHGPAFRPN